MIMVQNPDDLLSFLAVARAGSISAAARMLAHDPATIGRKILRLEDELGASLFVKSPKGYALTDPGRDLVAKAETLEGLMQEVSVAFHGQSDRLDGRVRIGAPDGCATFLLPAICSRLSKAHPDLVVDIVASSREFDLLSREVDIAISVSPAKAKAVRTTPLARYQLHFAAASGLLAQDRANLPSDLPLISYIPELLVDPGLDLPEAFRIKEPKLRSNSVLVQWSWLQQGAGVGLVHDFAFARSPGLERVYPDFALERDYHLNIRRDDLRFKRMQKLAGTLSDEIRREITIGQAAPWRGI